MTEPGRGLSPDRPFGRYATKQAADNAAASRARSTKAKNLARARLIEAHRTEYEELYATALAETTPARTPS